LIGMAMLLLGGTFAFAQMLGAGEPTVKGNLPPALSKVGIDQRLNEQVPLDLQFTDEQGQAVRLGDYFHSGRPVVVSLVYYDCPMLCGEVMQGMASTFKALQFTPGKEFEVVTLSIDPREKPELAAAKKKTFIGVLDRPEAASGWHFLTGERPQIDALANALGWHYHYDPKLDQFAHPAGIMLLTPQGKISQYYYGIEYSARDMRLGIIQASQNKIGSLTDQVLLYCYHYDPRSGKYGPVVMNIVRLAGGVTVLVLGGFLVLMFRLPGKGNGGRGPGGAKPETGRT
jgi:protein SCO1/2